MVKSFCPPHDIILLGEVFAVCRTACGEDMSHACQANGKKGRMKD